MDVLTPSRVNLSKTKQYIFPIIYKNNIKMMRISKVFDCKQKMLL